MSGDGLVPPLNAPPAAPYVPGTQPGTTPGIVLAQYVIVFGTKGGVFLYSGSPGPGNAPIAFMSTATKDPYGNTLTPASNVVIGAGQDGNPQVVLESSSGIGELAFPLPGTWTNYPNVLGEISGSGGLLSINGPTDTSVDDQAFLTLVSAAATGTGASAGEMQYTDSSAVSHLIAYWNPGGLTVPLAGQITSIKPGTGTSASNPGVQETWHAMSPLLNSWAAVGGNVANQYRKLASPANSVEIIGVLTATAATAATFFTLPAGYRPSSQQQFACGATSGVTANNAPYIQCDTSGNLSVNRVGLGAANSVVYHGFIALDA